MAMAMARGERMGGLISRGRGGVEVVLRGSGEVRQLGHVGGVVVHGGLLDRRVGVEL
jgi:hypothetical protein